MRSPTNRPGKWIESLEDRRLMSASLFDGGGSSFFSPPAAGLFISPLITTPNIVGTWTGNYTGSQSGTITIQVNTQTSRKGNLTGIMTTKQKHKHSSQTAFTGRITGDTVSMTATDGTVVSGTVSRHNTVISGTWKYNSSTHGDFSVTRVV